MAWLIVIGQRVGLEWVLEHQRMAFRKHVRTEALQAGDAFAIYTARGAYGNPSADESQVIATGTILAAAEASPVEIGGESFPASCPISVDQALPLRQGVVFRDLVPQMAFLGGDARRWPPAVHRTLVLIEESDFEAIREAISEAIAKG